MSKADDEAAGARTGPRWAGPARWPLRYTAAALATAAAFLLRMVLADYLGPPYILIYPTVLLTAMLGGPGPGLLSTALSALLAAGWILPAGRPDTGPSVREAVSLAAFVAMGLVVSVVAYLDREKGRRIADLEHAGALRERDERLRRRETELEEAQRVAHVGSWYWDASSQVTTGSEELHRIFGLAPAPSLPVFRDQRDTLYPAESWQRLLEASREALRSGAGYELDLEARRAGGEAIWVTTRGEVVRGAGGERLGLRGTVQDVTERRQAMERLARSERRYRLLADHASDVIWTLDLATQRFSYVSPSIRALRGLSVEEALAEPVEASLTPESLARVRAVMATIGTPAEQDPHTDVYDQPCRDGSVKHVEITTTLVRDPAGRPVEVIGVSRDATARVCAERGLADRARQQRAILETALDGFWVLDALGRFLQVNDAACAMSGYPRDELLRLRIQDLEAAETEAETGLHMREIERRGFDRFETRLRRQDGRIIDVEMSVLRADLDGGRFTCFARDISEAKRDREALQRSEERFRALIEKSTDMIMLLDQEGRFTFWSPSAVETFGWTPEQARGRLALEWLHPDDRPRVGEVLQRVLSLPGSLARDLLRYQHQDGSWRQIEVMGRNLLQDPAVRAVVLNARDVTAQRLLEEQFWQSQKLESVGRLAGGVAHDFNNLLTVILSGVEELQAPAADGSAPAAEIVEEIGTAAERARDLTRRLLAFARKQAVTPVSLDPGEVVQGSERLLRRLLGEDVRLVTSLAPAPWPVRCDRGQLEQVILNLAANAREAMPAGGQVSIETSNVELDGTGARAHPGMRPGPYVRLAVRDTGVGMTAEVKARLFEPFFTTKGVGKGTGLGLATVYGIVTQSEGFISVESEPGRGATFEVFLPRAHQEATAARPAPAPATARGTETVLVVEDDPMVRAVTLRALQSAGYRVLVASDGSEALERSQRAEGPIQLLVTDIVMPGPSGRMVAEALSRIHRGLRVLYVSGYTPDAIAERGVLEPGLELLQKPFTPASLLGRVRLILDRPA